MSYAIHEIELTRPLPTLAVREPDTGLALIVRVAGTPVGFVMRELGAGTTLQSEDVHRCIMESIDTALLREAMSTAGSNTLPLPGTLVAAAADSLRSLAFGRDLPSLTIAICTKDRPDDLAACLSRLREVCEAEPSGAAGIEILVVDNAPSDQRTRNLVASCGNVRYTMEPVPGLDIARNRAIRDASSELLAFIDDDVTVDRGWLLGLKRALQEHPDAAAVTGLVLPAELRTDAQILFERRGGFQKHFRSTRFGESLPGHPFYPCIGGRYGTGCNMAFRRRVLVELGGFDEALDTGSALPGGGDTDMFYRVVRSGHPLVYEPRFQVFHRHRAEIAQLRRQYSRSWGRGLMAYVSKTYRCDPAQRRNLRRLVSWWFGNELREIAHSMTGRHVLPPGMLFAELWGAIIGLCGAYDRSRRCVHRIRLQHAVAPETAQSR